MANEEPTLNVPSLLTLAAFAYFLFRWLFKSEPDQRQHNSRSGREGDRVEQTNHISQMFPQVDRRMIMWDLQRNGGSITATTERILSGIGLETPPVTFQPTIPPPTTAAPARNPTNSRPAAESLIARYNLADRIKAEAEGSDSGASSGSSSPGPVWSQNKSERQRLLQQRRDEMILAARRRMLEKEKEKNKTAEGESSSS